MKLQLIMLIQVSFTYFLTGAVLTLVFPPETGHVKIATFIAINVFIKIIPHPTSNNPFAFGADLRDWVYKSYGRDDLIIHGDKDNEKTIELIKEEFDIENLETLTATKWCKIKRLIKSNHFKGFYTYYFLAIRGCPWIEPETYDSGFIWQQDGNTTQKLQEALKSQLSYLRIPMRKTYIQRTEFGIALIPHFRSVKRDEIHAAVHILLDSDVQI